MIRVTMEEDKFILILAGVEYRPLVDKLIPILTAAQAADLHRQLGDLLPDELLNVEPFSSDELKET